MVDWVSGCTIYGYGVSWLCKKKRSLVREEREIGTLFASVIVTVSGKVYPLLLLLQL